MGTSSCALIKEVGRISFCARRAFNLFITCRRRLFLVRPPHFEQVGMSGRKYVLLHKPQPLIAQPATDDLLTVPLDKVLEVIGINDLNFNAAGLYDAAEKPAAPNPSLDLCPSHMESLRQHGYREPLAALPGAEPKSM
jgi:hypothetical protein